jgi:hypothetical protein
MLWNLTDGICPRLCVLPFPALMLSTVPLCSKTLHLNCAVSSHIDLVIIIVEFLCAVVARVMTSPTPPLATPWVSKSHLNPALAYGPICTVPSHTERPDERYPK